MSGAGSIGASFSAAACRRGVGAALLLLLIGLLPLSSVADDFQTPAISPAELNDRLASQDKPLLVDLRDPVEFRIAHVPGAVNIPQPDLDKHLPEIEGDRAVVLYCIVGRRTKLAEQLLIDHDVPNVFHLKGGLTGWMDAGFPIVKGGG